MGRQQQAGSEREDAGGEVGAGIAPGKRTRSEQLPVQRKARADAAPGGPARAPSTAAAPDPFGMLDAPAPQQAQPKVVQRKPVSEGWSKENSWNAGRTTVDKDGNAERSGGGAVPNAQAPGEPKPGANDSVTRVVLDNLSKAKSGKAIVVVPSADVLKAATSIDVLLHFHGGGDGKGAHADSVEQDNAKGGKGGDAERTHDLHLGKVPQQIAAHGGAILAITVQRTDTGASEAQDGLVDEVFKYLSTPPQNLLDATKHKRGRTISSGYSAGALNAVAEAAEHQPGSGKLQETIHGLFLYDAVGDAIGPAKTLIKQRIADDLAHMAALPTAAAQLNYLKTDGYLVRIFGESKRFNTNAAELQKDMYGWLEVAHPKVTDPGVREQWHSNYQAVTVPAKGNWDAHFTMENAGQGGGPIWDRSYKKGDGNVEKALNAWRDQHDPNVKAQPTPKPKP